MTWCRICQTEHANPCEFDPARKPPSLVPLTLIERPRPPATPSAGHGVDLGPWSSDWLVVGILVAPLALFGIGFALGWVSHGGAL